MAVVGGGRARCGGRGLGNARLPRSVWELKQQRLDEADSGQVAVDSSVADNSTRAQYNTGRY